MAVRSWWKRGKRRESDCNRTRHLVEHERVPWKRGKRRESACNMRSNESCSRGGRVEEGKKTRERLQRSVAWLSGSGSWGGRGEKDARAIATCVIALRAFSPNPTWKRGKRRESDCKKYWSMTCRANTAWKRGNLRESDCN